VDDLRAAFGDRLRKLREERGWSQEILAEKSDLHFTYISQIERGSRNPGLNSLGSLAKALGMRLPDLVKDLTHNQSVTARRKAGRPRKPK
jgi:transcriptional regulator with XRE-family HTH domain